MYNRSINPCRPGHGSSCALCCGSHNYTVSSEKIENIFLTRGQNCTAALLNDPEKSNFTKLFHDAMQCSHVGMVPSEQGVLSCLVYFNIKSKSKLKSYFNGTCKNFYCDAWDDLTDEQIIFAARLMEDWYYYSLFINDIEAVHELHAAYTYPEDVPHDELDLLKEELRERFIEEDGK